MNRAERIEAAACFAREQIAKWAEGEIETDWDRVWTALREALDSPPDLTSPRAAAQTDASKGER